MVCNSKSELRLSYTSYKTLSYTAKYYKSNSYIYKNMFVTEKHEKLNIVELGCKKKENKKYCSLIPELIYTRAREQLHPDFCTV